MALRDALNKLAETPPTPNQAVQALKNAVIALEKALNKGLDSAQDAAFRDQFAQIAREIADAVINQAIAQGDDLKAINKAQDNLDEGDTLRAAGAFKAAITQYKQAIQAL